jgi:hypothetical protein
MSFELGRLEIRVMDEIHHSVPDNIGAASVGAKQVLVYG